MIKGGKNTSSVFRLPRDDDKYGKTRDEDGNIYDNYTIDYYYESDYWIHAIDSNGNWFWQKRPGFIGLAHEFVHAYRAINGLYIEGDVRVPYTAQTTGVINGKPYTTKGKVYSVKVEEFRTVGLMPWENSNVIKITENDIRRENNYSNRAWYF